VTDVGGQLGHGMENKAIMGFMETKKRNISKGLILYRIFTKLKNMHNMQNMQLEYTQ
jgi:hypothetical protein